MFNEKYMTDTTGVDAPIAPCEIGLCDKVKDLRGMILETENVVNEIRVILFGSANILPERDTDRSAGCMDEDLDIMRSRMKVILDTLIEIHKRLG